MKYLIDTDVLIDHLRGREIISQEVIEGGASASIITLGELIYGAYKSENTPKALLKLKQSLELLDLNIINLDNDIISQFGNLKAILEKIGARLEDFDLLIAATAKVNDLILLTRNKRHFARVKGLRIA